MRFSTRQSKTPTLGALEIAVLRAMWASAEPADARGLHELLAARRISLSTIQATLERLHRKGLLARAKLGRAYWYSAAVTQSGLIRTLIRDVTERLAAGELEPVISGFVELVRDEEPELLDRLEAKAAEQRRRERP
jgi:predicted transcriptional regulator